MVALLTMVCQLRTLIVFNCLYRPQAFRSNSQPDGDSESNISGLRTVPSVISLLEATNTFGARTVRLIGRRRRSSKKKRHAPRPSPSAPRWNPEDPIILIPDSSRREVYLTTESDDATIDDCCQLQPIVPEGTDLQMDDLLTKTGVDTLKSLISAEKDIGATFLKTILDNVGPDSGRPLRVPFFICHFLLQSIVFTNCPESKDAATQESRREFCSKGLALNMSHARIRGASAFEAPARVFLKDFFAKIAPSGCPTEALFRKDYDGKNLAIPIMGPSAAGKTFGSKGLILPRIIGPKVEIAFLSIDGGSLRESYETYAKMLEIKQQNKVHMIGNLFDAQSVVGKALYGGYFSGVISKHKKLFQKVAAVAGANLLLPDTAPVLPDNILSGSAPHAVHRWAKLLKKYNYDLYIAAVCASRWVTSCQGYARQVDESKPYGSGAWPLSIYGIEKVIEYFREHGHDARAVLSFTEFDEDTLHQCKSLVSDCKQNKSTCSQMENLERKYKTEEPLFISTGTELRAHFTKVEGEVEDEEDEHVSPDGDGVSPGDGALSRISFFQQRGKLYDANFHCRCAETQQWTPCHSEESSVGCHTTTKNGEEMRIRFSESEPSGPEPKVHKHQHHRAKAITRRHTAGHKRRRSGRSHASRGSRANRPMTSQSAPPSMVHAPGR